MEREREEREHFREERRKIEQEIEEADRIKFEEERAARCGLEIRRMKERRERNERLSREKAEEEKKSNSEVERLRLLHEDAAGRKMESMKKMWMEEKDKLSNDFKDLIIDKDRQMIDVRKEKDDRLNEQIKNNLALVKDAHDNITKAKDSARKEELQMQLKIEEIMRESAAKQEESSMKTISIMQSNGSHVATLMHDMALKDAATAKVFMEMMANKAAENELAPIEGIKSDLIANVTKSSELWMELELNDENQNKIKNEIMRISQAMKSSINTLIITICKCSSLGNKKEQLKNELILLDEKAGKYAKNVTREIRNEKTTKERLRKLEDDCDELRMNILKIPDMNVDSLETLINRSVQRTIEYAENRGSTTAIGAPTEGKNMLKGDA